VVLDLGSGGGKICYMAAQLVGQHGRVIGVDMNDDMLALARKYRQEMATRLGGDRVAFHKGQIQDLALDLERLDAYLRENPVDGESGYRAMKDWEARERRESPMIPDASIDLVISNCVLNLVADEHKQQLVREIHRVLKPGGRVAIADIVSDRPVPAEMKQDPELWSGCISGAFEEQALLAAFAASDFHAIRYDKWDAEPWQTINGIDFRSVTLTAIRQAGGESAGPAHEIIYRGPFAEVRDDTGRRYVRGERTKVSAAEYARLTAAVYDDDFIDTARPSTPVMKSCCSPSPANSRTGKDVGCC
jgi:ubiquinone/menaquinone biosynthesis C-methylase UbiE